MKMYLTYCDLRERNFGNIPSFCGELEEYENGSLNHTYDPIYTNVLEIVAYQTEFVSYLLRKELKVK
jgi:hypothetical protein